MSLIILFLILIGRCLRWNVEGKVKQILLGAKAVAMEGGGVGRWKKILVLGSGGVQVVVRAGSQAHS